MKDKGKLLIIIGNILLIIFCILQVKMEINSTVISILIGIAIFIELLGIALGKDDEK